MTTLNSAPESVVTASVSALLRGEVQVETEVRIRGWVRTARHSKAGFSFVNLHDGSCFDAIQALVPAELDNYEEALRLSAGCAVIIEGRLVTSQGKGQSVELQATSLEVVGWVEQPETYPCLLYTSPSPRDRTRSRMPSSA